MQVSQNVQKSNQFTLVQPSAIYSASNEDRDIVGFLFDFQETRDEPMKK